MGLPGHEVASRMGANELSFLLCPFLPAAGRDPTHRAGLVGHFPVNRERRRE